MRGSPPAGSLSVQGSESELLMTSRELKPRRLGGASPPPTRGPPPGPAGRACGRGIPRESQRRPAFICQCDCEWAFAAAGKRESAGRGAFSLLGSERVGAALEAEPPSPRLGGARGSVGEV
eukprot:COSAG03_NODE_1600_length_3807_cov_6.991640_2_plen_121_part_00